jgi:hypothetical protein
LAGFAQAFMGAGGAAAAIHCHAKLIAQIPNRASASASGFVDLPIRHCLADADIHGSSPESYVNANNSHFTQLRTIVNNVAWVGPF